MVNGLQRFGPHVPLIRTHTHSASYHARCRPNHWEHLGVQCLAQGQSGTWTGVARDQTNNPAINGQLALPAEPLSEGEVRADFAPHSFL